MAAAAAAPAAKACSSGVLTCLGAPSSFSLEQLPAHPLDRNTVPLKSSLMASAAAAPAAAACRRNMRRSRGSDLTALQLDACCSGVKPSAAAAVAAAAPAALATASCNCALVSVRSCAPYSRWRTSSARISQDFVMYTSTSLTWRSPKPSFRCFRQAS